MVFIFFVIIVVNHGNVIIYIFATNDYECHFDNLRNGWKTLKSTNDDDNCSRNNSYTNSDGYNNNSKNSKNSKSRKSKFNRNNSPDDNDGKITNEEKIFDAQLN